MTSLFAAGAARSHGNNTDTTLNITETGAFTITGAGTWRDTPDDGLSSINNAGELVASAGGMMGMPITIEAALNSTGTLQVDAGNLVLKGGGLFDCALYVAADADVVMAAGDFVAQALNAPAPPPMCYRALTVGNFGDVANLIVNAVNQVTVERLRLQTGGAVIGGGGLLVSQILDWTGGGMSGGGNTEIAQGAVMVVTSAVALTGD